MPQVQAIDPILYLVRRQYPAFGIPIPLSRGPSLSSQQHNQLRQQAEDAKRLHSELSRKSSSEIDALVKREKLREVAEAKQRAKTVERERFFNQSTANADFGRYFKCAYWSIDEAVALSFGKQPTIVNWTSVEPLKRVSAFARAYELRREIALRAIHAKQLYDPVYPAVFLSWARQTGILVDAELIRWAEALGISLQSWKDLYEAKSKKHEAEIAAIKDHYVADLATLNSKLEEQRELILELQADKSNVSSEYDSAAAERPLRTQERENLQLIALLGAIKGYDYRPGHKNTAARRIMEDTEKLGMRFTDDSIRKHLSSAAEFIPPDWSERLNIKPNSDKH